MESENAFKNLINDNVVDQIAREIKLFYPDFNSKKFSVVSKRFPDLELKARVVAISQALKLYLPPEYPNALRILVKVIKNKKLSGFSLWPFSEFIGQHGLDHFDESLQAMYYLTKEFTSEFAVRPFFIKDHKKVLKFFHRWVTDKNVHIRRFVSEGSRPLLPWGLRLNIFKENPQLSVALLNDLKHDPELYVRKSVANHLNDVTKFNPDLVIQTLRQWEKDVPTEHANKIAWIKRHGLRTLIKKGHPSALKLMGVSDQAQVEIKNLKSDKINYKSNDKLNFKFTVQSKSAKKQKLIIDYVIYFVKANAKTTPKVFKLKTLTLEPKENLVVEKNHSLRPITTMVFYKGTHFLSIKVNGREFEKIKWNFN